MKKSVLVYGLILGLILVGNIFYQVDIFYNNPGCERNDVLGYAALVVVLSLIFFGTRNYRNKFLGGQISFWKAFKTGSLITLLASSMYVVVWLFYYYLFVPDFIDRYVIYVLVEAEKSGLTAEQLASKAEKMNEFREMYKNPLFVVAVTYAEILPIGLVVSLISALILKRKKKNGIPAETQHA